MLGLMTEQNQGRKPGMTKKILTMVVCNSSLQAESEGNTALNQVNTKPSTTLNKNRWLDELPIYSLSPREEYISIKFGCFFL